MGQLPFVSVIIPVYNDGERLKKCLNALENQSYPSDGYEVLVIDNASDEVQDIRGVVYHFAHAHYTYEAKAGSYAARNQGLTLAKGEIIAFTDADCLPQVNWLERGVQALLSQPKCGLVAGKIELFFREDKHLTPVELFEKVTAFRQEKLLKEFKGAATANVFTTRQVFNKVGGFNETLKSGGDLEWGSRVHQQGYQQIYDETVCVLHPARYSWSQLYQRTIRLTGGNYTRQRNQAKSLLLKIRLFLDNLFPNLVPPVNFFINTFKSNPLLGVSSKLKICLAMCFVRYVTLVEIIRLQLGGQTAKE